MPRTEELNPIPAPAALLDTTQAARALGISRRTLENRRVSGIDSPQHIKIGRSVRYDPRDLEAFLAERRRRSTSDQRAIA
jgi:predicted DNA-binding transcriptional regulator AlpA